MCVAQVYWTKEVGEAITTEGFKGLTKYGEKCTAELNKIVSLVRGQLTSLERATCGSLVVIDVHARDVTVQVGKSAQPGSKSGTEAAAGLNPYAAHHQMLRCLPAYYRSCFIIPKLQEHCIQTLPKLTSPM